MYFFDLGLTPFEAGKQVGSSDLVKKNRLFFSSEDLQQIPQGILEEKKAFAAKCEKICRTVYPKLPIEYSTRTDSEESGNEKYEYCRNSL